MKAIRYYFVLVCIFIIANIVAQQNTINPDTSLSSPTNIELLLKYEDQKVMLRWAPTSSILWYKLNQSGYRLKRVELNENLRPIEGSEQVWDVNPWDEEAFRPYLNTDNKYVLAAGHCLHGDLESTKEEGFNMFGQYQETTNKYSLALLSADFDGTAARALALGFVDETVRPSTNYLYSIYSPVDSLQQVYRKSVSIITTQVSDPDPVIDNVVEEENHLVVQINKFLNQEYYTGYWLERSQDGGPFERIHKNPLIGAASKDFGSQLISFRDSVPQYVSFNYRIIGITPFATTSNYSAVKGGMARDQTPPDRPQNLTSADENASIKLSWDPVMSDDLSHYNVYRSPSFEGSFAKINSSNLSKVETFYFDTDLMINQSPYYKIGAVDTAGNENLSLVVRGFLRDTLAPAIPTGLVGSIDSSGIVNLSWTPNTEDDLDGYFVYFANSPKDFFTNLTGFPVYQPSYVDTISLKTFTEEIYYRVTSVDFHNHISKFSEILMLKKPDTIPPSPPSLRNYKIEDDHIKIGWTPSRSHDVSFNRIYKKKVLDDAWSLWSENPEELLFDRDVVYGETYMYQMVAEDDDGNFSKAKEPLVITFLDKRPIEPPLLHKAKLDTLSKSISLQWTRPTNASNYILYRSINNGPFVTHERFKSQVIFNDGHRLKPGNAYGYKIKSVSQDGRRSKFSNAVFVTLKNEDDHGI